MRISGIVLCLLFSLCALAQPEWRDSPFIKVQENPIMGADSTLTFFCPVRQQTVRWQRADVFNPAAVVKEALPLVKMGSILPNILNLFYTRPKMVLKI
jgi:hypothetical protein